MSRAKKGWTPMRRATPVPPTDEQRVAMTAAGVDPDHAAGLEMWRNDLYVAIVDRHPDEGFVVHLSIRRDDRRAIRDWRDMQRIKEDIAGPDVEAVELYPCRDRLIDGANQYHLWCAEPGVRFPFGYTRRDVSDTADAAKVGAVQRPLPPGWREVST